MNKYLENIIDNTNKYITSCGHTFHMTCMWNYLVANNCVSKIHPQCKKMYPNGKNSCCNTGKIIKSFNCPMCKLLIANN